ncbi:MAG: Bcr/CflA family drug resistance efflux transporter [Opitutaceae bacterium]|nr:Bcr/CflA family drug resistance efflux transporter [Opitutaceae bacterium]
MSALAPQRLPARWLLILMLGSLTAFVPLSIDMYLPAFPQIAKEFGVEIGQVQLTLSVYLIGMAMGQIFYGAMSDRWGRRRLLIFGMIIFALATAGCALAGSIEALMLWRFGVAVGGSAGMVVTRAIVRDSFDVKESANIFSLLMLVMGAAPILAPFIGGQLLLITEWRGIFWVLAIFATLSIVTVVKFMPETLAQEDRVQRDLRGILGIYTGLLRDRVYFGYVLSIGCVSGMLFAYIAGSATLFIEQYGVSAQAFGVFFGVNSAGLIIGAQANRWLLKHLAPRKALELAYALNTAMALVLVLQVWTGWGGFPAAISILFVTVGSTGFLFPNITALAMAPKGRVAGSASAIMGTVQFGIGGAAGSAVALLYNGSALPMAAVLASCSIIGCSMLRVMAVDDSAIR